MTNTTDCAQPIAPRWSLVGSTDATEKLLLRPAEFAFACGISRSMAYELIARGVVPSVRLGGSVRVPVAEMRAWIAEQVAERFRLGSDAPPQRRPSG